MTLLLDRIFASVAWSHFVVDVLNGQLYVLLAYLSGPLSLTNALLGGITTAYQLAAALMQPVFGYLSDRFGSRWIIAGGVAWMTAFFALAVAFPGRASLAWLVLASIGSGAFHPAGSAEATRQGQALMAHRETTAASYFFVFGQTGFFIGPLIGGALLEKFGPPGLLLIALAGLPAGWSSASALGTPAAKARHTTQSGAAGGKFRLLAPAGTVAALVAVAAAQSFAQANMNTFLPKYLADLGRSAGAYGAISALFMGGTALGNLLGGVLADRFGKRRVIAWGLALSSLPLALTSWYGQTAWLFVLAPLAGALTGLAFSVIIVMAQKLVPGGMALVSGLVLGIMFSSGALGVLASGYLADRAGIPAVFLACAVAVLIGALLTVKLAE